MSFAFMSSEKEVLRYPSSSRSAVQTQQQPQKAFSAAWQIGTQLFLKFEFIEARVAVTRERDCKASTEALQNYLSKLPALSLTQSK